MIIWRYENADGVGPYSREVIPEMNKQHNSDEFCYSTHPGWYQYEPFRWSPAGIIWSAGPTAGCPTLKDLEDWFDGWHEQLAEKGFRIIGYRTNEEHVIEVPNGIPQVIFHFDLATRIAEYRRKKVKTKCV